eukprot:TRINITY_DN203_c0_g1_i2.p3 TRINITY_DN203_c0_g1~~TRINITY_DN203_c0_g1_i2.p3  ORF type:complete len:113 (+),score=3.93 TRINITY_DN203_c0_g1_i2:213-551(+)
MPRRREAMKDVDSCEKLRGAANKRGSGGLRIGKPDRSTPVDLWLNTQAKGGQPGELKHLSTRWKINQTRFPQQRRANGEEPKPSQVSGAGSWDTLQGVSSVAERSGKAGQRG